MYKKKQRFVSWQQSVHLHWKTLAYLTDDIDKVEDLTEEELEGVGGVSAPVKSPVLDNVVNHVGLSLRVNNWLLMIYKKKLATIWKDKFKTSDQTEVLKQSS